MDGELSGQDRPVGRQSRGGRLVSAYPQRMARPVSVACRQTPGDDGLPRPRGPTGG